MRVSWRPSGPRTARRGIVAASVAVLFGFSLTACGTSPTAPPATITPSVPVTTAAPSASPTPTAESPSPVSSGATASFDACALLTTVELAEILHTDSVQPKMMPSGGWVAGQCGWSGAASGFLLGVGTAESISDFGDAAAVDAKEKVAQYRAASGTSQDVAGIGDAAVVSPNGIAAYRGDMYLEITNLGLTEEQLVEIAKLAIARL